MLITLHMFSLSVVCTLNTQLKLLPFKRYTVLRRTVNGNFILTPTVVSIVVDFHSLATRVLSTLKTCTSVGLFYKAVGKTHKI